MSFFQRRGPGLTPRPVIGGGSSGVSALAPARSTSAAAREVLDIPDVAAGIRHLLKLASRLVATHDGSEDFRAAAERIRVDLDRACLGEDLRSISRALRALDLPVGGHGDEGLDLVGTLLQPVVDSIILVAKAIGPEAPHVGLARIREQLLDPKGVADAAAHLARLVEHLASSVEWMQQVCDVLKVSVGEMLSMLGRLAQDEPAVLLRLEAIRDRIGRAVELHELETLRTVLLRETEVLVEGAQERTVAFEQAHGTLVETRRQVAVLESALGDAEARARTDALTGLPNRHGLSEALQALAKSTTTTGVLAIDLDHFKRVNDAHGHGAGDIVLRRVASLIAQELRGDDRAFRVGGEELLVLLHDVDTVQATATAERLRRRVAREPVTVGDVMVPVTISIGVATWTEGRPFDLVSAEADAALYRAKGAGRNRVAAA